MPGNNGNLVLRLGLGRYSRENLYSRRYTSEKTSYFGVPMGGLI
jgi:hypothetical protein